MTHRKHYPYKTVKPLENKLLVTIDIRILKTPSGNIIKVPDEIVRSCAYDH